MRGDHEHAEEVRRDGSHGNDPVDEPAGRRRLVDGSHEQIRRERDEEHRHRVAAYLLRPLEHETVERQDDRGDRAGARVVQAPPDDVHERDGRDGEHGRKRPHDRGIVPEYVPGAEHDVEGRLVHLVVGDDVEEASERLVAQADRDAFVDPQLLVADAVCGHEGQRDGRARDDHGRGRAPGAQRGAHPNGCVPVAADTCQGTNHRRSPTITPWSNSPINESSTITPNNESTFSWFRLLTAR